MATAYSDEVAVGSYNRIRLRVEYSGTSATCYMEFRRTSSYTGSWADSQSSITFNGTTVSAPYSYSGTVGTSWVQLCNASGFSVSTSGGTYSWSFNNPGSSSVLGCSGTITISSQGSAPSGGYINGLSSSWDTTNNRINVSATSVGVTSTGGLSLTALQFKISNSAVTTSGVPANYTDVSNGGSGTVNNGSYTVYGGITISPNTTHYAGLTAVNDAGTYRYSYGTFTTVCAPVTVSISSMTNTSVTIAYSTSADGEVYSKSIQYSIDGGTTWVTGATVSSGSATSGTYTISGLTSGTTYSIQTRVSTTAGTTTGETLSATLGTAPKLYGGSSQGALKIGKLYGSVSGTTKKVKKLYGSVNGVAKLIFRR